MRKKRKILSLDGGGIKGVFAASFLSTVQESTGKIVSDYFDLVAGTSTGGIIALGLGLGMTPKDILHFYLEEGPKIFDQEGSGTPKAIVGRFKHWFKQAQASTKQLVAPKYNPTALRTALSSAFGTKVLGDSKLRLIIPAYHADNEDVYVFKTRHHPRFELDWMQSAVNVALATAAAPTYFSAQELPCGSQIIDGGIWANNPVGMAAVEARTVLDWRDDELFILRIGCTEEPIDIPVSAGYAGLLMKSTQLFMQGQSRGSDGTAILLCGQNHESQRFFSIQPKVPSGKFTLDKTCMIDRLAGMGAAYARKHLPMLQTMFLAEKSDEFIPYPSEHS